MRRVLIVDGKPQLSEKARLVGLTPLQIPLSRLDPEIIANEHQTNPFAMIIAQSETGLLEASRLSAELNTFGTPLGLAELLNDKLSTREALRNTSLNTIPALLGTSVKDILKFKNDHCKAGVIVKPRRGTGSLGVQTVCNYADAKRAVDNLAELDEIPFLMERRVVGREFSVETFTQNSRHLIACITEKIVNQDNIECGHIAPASLEREETIKIHQTIHEFLKTINLKEGPAHTEIMLRPDGVDIIESHPRRGGDYISELVKLVYDIDLEILTFGVPFGLLNCPIKCPPPKQTAVSCFLSCEPGRVTDIKKLDTPDRTNYTHMIELKLKTGYRIGDLRSSKDRIGCIIATGETKKDAMSFAEEAASGYNITLNGKSTTLMFMPNFSTVDRNCDRL